MGPPRAWVSPPRTVRATGTPPPESRPELRILTEMLDLIYDPAFLAGAVGAVVWVLWVTLLGPWRRKRHQDRTGTPPSAA